MAKTEFLSILRAQKEKALAIYSHFKVAAVLVTTDGRLFTGVNIESSSYGLTMCAERVALFKALSEGYREFKELHLISDAREPCPPCGACRQLLMDYAPNLKVVMYGEGGDSEENWLKELLPKAFTPDNLENN